MKREGIVPSEVMYTSLMTHAGNLVALEKQRRPLLEEPLDDTDTKAIEVYTELMMSLMLDSDPTTGRNNRRPPGGNSDNNALLVKVFLVFQEMKTVGATPDLACYNALLRACARAGDVSKAQEVLKKIQKAGLLPNDSSWREMIRVFGKAGRIDLAEATWTMALEYRDAGGDGAEQGDKAVLWRPSVASFGAMAAAYLRQASMSTDGIDVQREMYRKVIIMYKDVLAGKQDRRLNLVGREALHDNPRVILLVLQAIVSLVDLTSADVHCQVLRDLAISIVKLECFHEGYEKKEKPLTSSSSRAALRESRAASHALRVSRSWLSQARR